MYHTLINFLMKIYKTEVSNSIFFANKTISRIQP